MHIDLGKGGPDRVQADVAVIGAGAAGISLADRLIEAGLRVVLLESGGIDYEGASAALNAGENAGLDYYPLDHARLRMFGGTTAIWGGRCSELDPIDFARRNWVPHSGWPFGYETIAPFYAEARERFGLPGRMPRAADLAAAGIAMPDLGRDLVTPCWGFDEQFDRFSFSRWRGLIDHPRMTVFTHANVREILAEHSGTGIAALDVRSLGGRRLRVEARDYVLAAGGIENARLLLASNSVVPAGLGNGHDQVGRYFMEHPHARGGRIVGGDAMALLRAFAKHRLANGTAAALIAPSAALQEREGLLNTSLTIAGRRPADGRESLGMRLYLRAKHRTDPNRLGRNLWKATKRAVGWLQRYSDPLRPYILNKAGVLDIALVVRGEQAPNPDSRVTLSKDRDAAGMPRAVLDWRTSALDVHSVAGLLAALDRALAASGKGRVEAASWLSDPAQQWVTDPLISAHPIGGYHHIGTTRMSGNPRTGVTDGDGRVHGIGNLYVAGSSLFPTGGWANPTLTIVALALRTADTIARRQQRRSAA
ncbi:FAD-dependent oxidoreductase [Sphingomonas sp. ID0503]|uniref:FAD-dependent oxidoreductase n=1 Tax=Sphingomonas sp. ID0503 TaxID=3399691 RepID=UPI003AFB74FB